MVLNRNDRGTIRQYLLGQLAAEEQQALERRLLTEDDLFQELEVAEDELVDDFVAHKLAQAEREQFQQHFLTTPERVQQLTFAAALRRYTLKKTDDESVRMRSALPSEVTRGHRIRLAWNAQSWLFRAAALAAAAIVLALVVWVARPHVNSPQSYATLTLAISSSDRAQGGAATKLRLPLQAEALRLRLELPETAPQYRIELLRENGETQGLKPVGQDEQSVVVEVPASQLSRGQYALKVYAIRPDHSEQGIKGSYLLTVE